MQYGRFGAADRAPHVKVIGNEKRRAGQRGLPRGPARKADMMAQLTPQ